MFENNDLKTRKNPLLKLLIIGHRGAGKTRLLKKLTPFLKGQGIGTYHLDEEIEKKNQKSIKEIFKIHGESFFRKCEIICLKELIKEHNDKNLIIDLGAGFTGKKPKNFKALWLQRNVDLSKALFPDRPALENSPKTSLKRFQERQKKYHSMADYQLELCEDLFGDTLSMKNFFKKTFLEKTPYIFKNQWFLTKLHKKHHSLTIPVSNKNHHLSPLLGSCPQWELRDDLLPLSLLERTIKKLPKSLISLRKKESLKKSKSLISENSLWDWPLEWGLEESAKILSLHQRKESLTETLNHLPQTDQIIKLALPINSFKELKQGYEWFLERPEKRVFLPLSKTGRWKWFRLLLGFKMPFSFLRESPNSYPDQPCFMDLLNHQSSWSSFMAILGSPVNHSLTPGFHRDFFNKKKINCLAIDLLKDEWDSAFPFLDELGLRACAITSPLKKKAGQWMGQKSRALNTFCKLDPTQNEQIQKIQTVSSEPKTKKSSKNKENQRSHLKKTPTSLNKFFTTKSKNSVWTGVSTDEEGFKKLVSDVRPIVPEDSGPHEKKNTGTLSEKPQKIQSKGTEEDKKTVVWGGGDTLDMIKKRFPKAVFYSSRTGQIKPMDNWILKTDKVVEDPEQTRKSPGHMDLIYEKYERNKKKPGLNKPNPIDFSPDLLIWAVGTKNFYKKGVYPPKSWKPEKLIDLNYGPDSPGLFCANQYGCEYQSGLIYFIEQAKKQQEFWNECRL